MADLSEAPKEVAQDIDGGSLCGSRMDGNRAPGSPKRDRGIGSTCSPPGVAPAKREIPMLTRWETALRPKMNLTFLSLDDDERELQSFLQEGTAFALHVGTGANPNEAIFFARSA